MKTPVDESGTAGIPRRQFVQAAAMAVGGVGMASFAVEAAPVSQKSWRAAVIGRTGGGDYGHGYDQVFKGLDNVTVAAVADADPAGLIRAAQRMEAKRRYADYWEMLEREKPDLVCIAPRFPDCHPAMALAAIQVAKGIFIEKPLKA
jgi:predicted dehydrogenase